MSKIRTIGIVLAVMLILSGIASANLSGGVSLLSGTNTPPVITVLGTDPIDVERYSTYTDAGATANDAEDGDLTASIITDKPVDVAVVGAYTVTYTVTDSQGATDIKTRTVNVVDTTAPADVTGLAAGTVTTTSIQITWSNTNAALSPDFTNVVVTVTKHSDGSPVAGWTLNPVGTVETTTITGLEPGTAYDILVQTEDDQP